MYKVNSNDNTGKKSDFKTQRAQLYFYYDTQTKRTPSRNSKQYNLFHPTALLTIIA